MAMQRMMMTINLVNETLGQHFVALFHHPSTPEDDEPSLLLVYCADQQVDIHRALLPQANSTIRDKHRLRLRVIPATPRASPGSICPKIRRHFAQNQGANRTVA